MAAGIVRFASRARLLSRERVKTLRQLALEFEAEAPQAVAQIVLSIDRNTAAERGWSFVMLSPAQNRAVVRWIMSKGGAKRPHLSAALWAECFCHLRTDTGEIVMTRKQMMEATGGSSPHLSVALGELVGIGALIRHREGREVRWFMNPRVGTHLTGAAREEAQRSAPPVLSVLEGGEPRR